MKMKTIKTLYATYSGFLPHEDNANIGANEHN